MERDLERVLKRDRERERDLCLDREGERDRVPRVPDRERERDARWAVFKGERRLDFDADVDADAVGCREEE